MHVAADEFLPVPSEQRLGGRVDVGQAAVAVDGEQPFPHAVGDRPRVALPSLFGEHRGHDRVRDPIVVGPDGELGDRAPEDFGARPTVEPLRAAVPVRDAALEVGRDQRHLDGVEQLRLQVDLALGLLARGDVLHRAAHGPFAQALETHLRPARLAGAQVAVLKPPGLAVATVSDACSTTCSLSRAGNIARTSDSPSAKCPRSTPKSR